MDVFNMINPFLLMVGLALFVGVLAPWALWAIWFAPKRGQLKREVYQRRSEAQGLWEDLQSHQAESEDLRQQADHYAARVQRVLDTEGRIWERPADGPVPEFRPRHTRNAPIISLMNLKGGVGKTTIAGNLGAMMAQLGRNVLMVDLDFQGSLSSLCLDGRAIQAIRDQQRFVHVAFADQPTSPADFRRSVVRIGQTTATLVAADEDLVNCEQRQMTRWLIGESPDDVRFRLRSLLHSDELQGNFDVILLDCPPRLTTTSVNALAASDFVLIPTLLDATSAERVPSLLAWLGHLKQTQLCPDLSVLGVVANQTQQKNELTSREQGLWRLLQQSCADRWGATVPHFATAVPRREAFPQAAERNEFAAFDPDLQDVFESLVREVDQGVANSA